MDKFKFPPPSLEAFNNARSFQAGGYQIEEGFIYDRVTYLAAGNPGGTVSLDLFTQTSADESVTNLKQAGTIPKPWKFHGYKLFVVPDVEVTGAEDLDVAASRIRDISRIFRTNRGLLKLTPATTGRPMGPYPLHSIGEPNPLSVSLAGTSAAHLSRVFGANGDNAMPFEIALDSNEELKGSIKWWNAQAITADLALYVVIAGYWFKKAG